MSDQFALRLQGRFAAAFSAARGRLPPGQPEAWLRALHGRLARIDLAATLIRLADGIETGCRYLWRGLRGLAALMQRPIPRLTSGLIWRGAAAATGLGLTASLVAALSAGSEPARASLSESAEQDSRPIRKDPLPGLTSRDSWVTIIKPNPIFALEAPELERMSASFEARRSPDGSRREEILGFGGFGEQAAHLHLRLMVEHEHRELSQPFLIALVREAAARAMSVQRSGTPATIRTRFGPVETADATLSDGEASRPCIAFRMSSGTVPMALSGWWCGDADKPADRSQLACLIERIDLVNGGEDRTLRAAFARTERNRQQGCAQLLPSDRKVSQSEAEPSVPAPRTRSAAAIPPKRPPNR
ncbi:hypothetical protein [Bosea sp. Root381]|uniref:hypothetical protein n=1 Tax=Bosea sp. Root381 TaxID=1736524 RepID=UPI0012E380F1|nr:hypothetical protein [Bosea sp. Root381]